MNKKKALILAGGKGTRLRPITDDMPKPLVPIANVPIITHVLRTLKKNGISDAAITLGHSGDKIKEYLDSVGTEGVSVVYFDEETPLGTAGSAAHAMSFFDGDFAVVGGDTVFDFDITPAFEYHKNVGAVATILLSHSDDPRRYGSAYTDSHGRITSFVEKPEWKHVRSDAISTGIYILSPEIFNFIPRGKFCDFAKDVFPNIIGGALFAYTADGYFCDVGTPGSYLAANLDAAAGRIKGDFERTCVSPKAKVSPSAEVIRSVVMDGAVIDSGATVKDSVVCRGAMLMKNSTSHRAVIDSGTVVKDYTVATTNADICEYLASVDAKAAAAERMRVASSEQAEQIAPDTELIKYTVTGSTVAPRGAAKTLGELVKHGAQKHDYGVKLVFDDGNAVISCVDRNTVEITGEARTRERAEELYVFAKNGIKNLF